MDSETFREFGHRIVDWMADYRRDIGTRPVLPLVSPGEVRAQLPVEPPRAPVDTEALLADFERIILPGMTHWNHPRFFAYFPANNSGPSILAEMLTAVMGAQCMSWQTSPAATEVEQVTMDWLRQMLGLPSGFTGVIQDTASTSTLVALLMAREVGTGYQYRRLGASAENAAKLRIYASAEAHSSVEKGAFLAGLGSENLRRIPVDTHFAMRPDALLEAIVRDREAGLRPTAVVATLGSTSSTAFDSLEDLGAICREHGVFLHVDAAFAGNAAILPEMRWMLKGIEHADTLAFNPHKWMFVNFDCAVLFVKDPEALQRTCAINPEYLKTLHDKDVVNFRDWGPQLGRRFRALKLWWVIRTFGVEGLQAKLREHLRLARTFTGWVEESKDFELLAPTSISLVCFRYAPTGVPEEALSDLNARLLLALNATGEAYLTHTVLNGRYTLRLVTAQEMTTEADVARCWTLIGDLARTLH